MLLLMHTCGILTAGYVSTGYQQSWQCAFHSVSGHQKINYNLIRVGGQQNDEKML